MERTPIPMAFAPRPPQQAEQPQQSSAVDILSAMKQLVGTPLRSPEPIYRPGYKKPKAPELEWITSTAHKVHDNNRLWRELVYTTLLWARQRLTGAFPEDIAARMNGFQEEYISSALSAERTLIISKGAALKPSFRKRATSDENQGYAQRLEDAAVWLRAMEQRKHARMGNRPLELDEWSLFTDYGMYVSRDTLNPVDTTCPVKMVLIDPAQVNPIWGPDGLSHVFRVYRDTAERICAIYGDFNPAQKKKLENETGKIGDDSEFEVVEYWDTWYRAVMIGDTTVMPVTEHKYGDTPYSIQYGGLGEPMMTRTPGFAHKYRASSQFDTMNTMVAEDRMYKAVPYLYYSTKTHEIFEAVMARLITGYKMGLNPATVRYRALEIAEQDMEELDASPGAQNEMVMGLEKVEALPTANLDVADRLLGALGEDKRTGSAPPEMFGRMDKSNITGVAQAGANDAGMHLLFPTTKAWEVGLSLRYERIFRLLGNFGHLASYGNGGGSPKPIMVPSTRKKTDPAYPFDREVIDKVGPEIDVSFTKVDPRDWAPLFAAGANGVKAGFITREAIHAIATGDHDFERFSEEWSEENALFGAQETPEFQKMNVLAAIVEQIKEHEGQPEVQEHYKQMFQLWMQLIQPPQQQMGQPGMGGPPGMGQPQGMGGQQMGMGGPPQATPGVPGQMSYPQLGAGPGAMGGQVGRPEMLQGSDVGP